MNLARPMVNGDQIKRNDWTHRDDLPTTAKGPVIAGNLGHLAVDPCNELGYALRQLSCPGLHDEAEGCRCPSTNGLLVLAPQILIAIPNLLVGKDGHSRWWLAPNGSRLSCGALVKDPFLNLRAPSASSAG